MRVFRFCIKALRSSVTYIGVILYTLIIGPPAIMLALVSHSPVVLYWTGYLGVHLAFRLAGIRVQSSGLTQVQSKRVVVYCANHTSNIEPLVLFLLLSPHYPKINILYKAGLRKIPILGLAFKLGGFVAIERGNRDQSNLAIDQAVNSLREGSSFLIFPEGTRSQTEELLPFKKGGFIMAVRAHVPIIPVAMYGGRAVMRRGSALLNPVTVHVQFGSPISTRDREFADREELIAETKSSIEDMLGRWKSTRPFTQSE